MTAGKATDFKIYDDQVRGSMVERIAQNIAAFNGASRGSIRLGTVSRRGNYYYESMFKKVAAVSRRDPSSLSPVADTPMTMDEFISVKLNRSIGPVAQTLDAFKKVGMAANADTISQVLGSAIADDMTGDMLNAALKAGANAIGAQAGNKATISSNGTLNTSGLVDGLAKMGDHASNIICWVMHSKPYYDLVKQQIAANIDGVSNFNVASASPITLNRPVLVTDSASLIKVTASPASTDYYTLGLTADALLVEDSEETTFVSQIVTGLASLVARYQGEYAFNLGVKGFKWDVGNGGANPNDTALGTGSNWDVVATSGKDLAGVLVQSR